MHAHSSVDIEGRHLPIVFIVPCVIDPLNVLSLAVQQKEITQSTSTSTITLVTSTQPISMVTSSGSASTLSSSLSTDLPIATASADVAADIAKYTSKVSSAGKF